MILRALAFILLAASGAIVEGRDLRPGPDGAIRLPAGFAGGTVVIRTAAGK